MQGTGEQNPTNNNASDNDNDKNHELLELRNENIELNFAVNEVTYAVNSKKKPRKNTSSRFEPSRKKSSNFNSFWASFTMIFNF